MNSHHLRRFVAVILFGLSLVVLAASVWPLSRQQFVIDLPELVLPLPDGQSEQAGRQQPAILELRQIVLEAPAQLRVQDSDWFVLSLRVAPQLEERVNGVTGEQAQTKLPDLYATHNVVAVASLEMVGLGAWREPLREPLRPGRPVTFRWALRADETGESRGVVWLSLEFVPQAGGEVQKMVLLSRPITLEAITVVGLPGWLGRILGGAGLAVSALLALSLVVPTLSARKKR
jgi:hypothetical protein